MPVNPESSLPPSQSGQPTNPPKSPRLVLGDCTLPHAPTSPSPTIFSFPPNRETLGGTAYLIVDEVNLLVDCPAWDAATLEFLQAQGGVRWLFLTHRGAIARVREIQKALNCEVILQEQEAYLLPDIAVTTFAQEFVFTPQIRALWTPGHSPGSACLYDANLGGVLFSGRHLLPNPQGKLEPLKTAKTFHWQRQLHSVRYLLEQFSPATLQWVCPGANLGFLRGRYAVSNPYPALQAVMTEALMP